MIFANFTWASATLEKVNSVAVSDFMRCPTFLEDIMLSTIWSM